LRLAGIGQRRSRLLGLLTSEHFGGKPLSLNILPPTDTPMCPISARTFNERAAATDWSAR
jgi:peroxiredoxin